MGRLQRRYAGSWRPKEWIPLPWKPCSPSRSASRPSARGLEIAAKSQASAVYIVDSFGAMYPEQVRQITKLYQEILTPVGKEVGFHAHNNQQLAFANTIEAIILGANMLDGSMAGLGRGAGNCPLELLLGFLHNPRYQLRPVLKCIQDHIEPLRQELLTLYRDNIRRHTRLFAGMPELLDRLEHQGLRWGLVTNKPGWLTEPLIAALGLNGRPACVVSGDTTAHAKPHPAPILHACKLAASEPAACLYVGDAERDIRAGISVDQIAEIRSK